MEATHRSPYFLMDVFRLRTIRIGILLFLLLMVLNSSALFVNVFTGVGMKIDNWQNAALNNWAILGYFIGAVVAIALGKRGVHLKYLFALGFVFIGLSALFMYFEVQTAGLYERMKYPVIIRATGMMLLYSLTAVLANQRMPYKYLSTWICIMLTARMMLGPAVGTALYTNVMQHRQQHYITRLAHDTDLLSPETAASYTGTIQGMMHQGKSRQEAEQMAALSAKGKVQVQATLASVKEMSGWTLYACMGCAVLVLVLPYRKRRITTDSHIS